MQFHDLYLFVYPPAAAIRRIQELTQGQPGMGTPMPPERLHITLHPLGRFEDGVPVQTRHKVIAAVSTVMAEAFRVCFDHVEAHRWPTQKATLALSGHGAGVAALRRWRSELGAALHAPGGRTGQARHPFRPHITLDYDHRLPVRREVAPIAWTVTELCLVASHYGQGVHETLHRWPLSVPRQRAFDGW